MAGTIISESWDGAARCRELLASAAAVDAAVDRLVALSRHHGLDGWLVNIENEVLPEQVQNISRLSNPHSFRISCDILSVIFGPVPAYLPTSYQLLPNSKGTLIALLIQDEDGGGTNPMSLCCRVENGGHYFPTPTCEYPRSVFCLSVPFGPVLSWSVLCDVVS